jgi:hypothetical protein
MSSFCGWQILLHNVTSKYTRNFHVGLLWVFFFSWHFKQDISCNDICMKNCHHSFFFTLDEWLWKMPLIMRSLMDSFMNNHIIVRKKKLGNGLLLIRWNWWLGENSCVYGGTNTGGFLMHSNSGSNEPFIRLRWITRQWWGRIVWQSTRGSSSWCRVSPTLSMIHFIVPISLASFQSTRMDICSCENKCRIQSLKQRFYLHFERRALFINNGK